MHVVTIVLAAEEDELSSIGESNAPLDEWSGIEATGLDTLKVATLHCLLTGDSMQMALDLYEPAYVSAGETVVLRLADEVLEKLASLDGDAMNDVASELALTEEFERALWDTEAVLEQLTELSGLAQLAESQGQVLFVWIYFVEA
jgi:hypothetical protein